MSLDLSKVATKLLRELASEKESGYVQLKRENAGFVHPVSGLYIDGVVEYIPLNAAVTDMPQSMVGDRIQISDKLVTVDNLTTPTSKDLLVIGGVEHQLILINGVGGHAGATQVIRMAARK
jgi:hypothetical protein